MRLAIELQLLTYRVGFNRAYLSFNFSYRTYTLSIFGKLLVKYLLGIVSNFSTLMTITAGPLSPKFMSPLIMRHNSI